MLFGKPLYQWKKPKQLKFKLSDFFITLKLFLKAYLVGLVIIILVYVYLKNISSGEIDTIWDNIFMKIIPCSFIFIVGLSIIGAIQSILDFTTYQISEKGIRSSGSPNWFLKWPKIQGYWTELSKKNDDICFIVFLSGKRRRFLPLPQDKELSEQIIQTVSQRISQITPVDNPGRYTLSNVQFVFLIILTLVYSYAWAYASSPYGLIFNLRLQPSTKTILMFSVLIFGPGSLGLAILAKGKWSEFRKGILCAFIFNYFAFVLMMVFLILIAAKYYLNLAEM